MILLHYTNFSAFAVLGPSGELLMIRALPHVGDRKHPARFGETLVNTAASMNLAAPRVHIVPMCDDGANDLVADLAQFFSNRDAMDIGVIDLSDIPKLDDVPGKRVEMLLADQDIFSAGEDGKEALPLAENETFVHLAEGWATQDF